MTTSAICPSCNGDHTSLTKMVLCGRPATIGSVTLACRNERGHPGDCWYLVPAAATSDVAAVANELATYPAVHATTPEVDAFMRGLAARLTASSSATSNADNAIRQRGPLVIWENENGLAYAWGRIPAEDETGDDDGFDTLGELLGAVAVPAANPQEDETDA